MAHPRSRRPALLAATALMGMLLAVQLPLALNPGYFSHDELQWAAAAETGVRVDWGDIGALQYRPLTFSLWLALSRAFFATPELFHLALTLLGSLNGLLLAYVLQRVNARPGAAAAGALAFVLSPYAMYVHGWVGTLGDVLWVGCGLLIGAIALHVRPVAAGIAAIALTAMGLLAKEAALAIPALAAVLATADAPRRRTWIAVAAGSGIAAVVYLGLRWNTLGAVDASSTYAWSPVHGPLRWLEYQVYAAQVPVFEAHNTLAPGYRMYAAVAGLLALGALAAVARTAPRLAVAGLAGGIAALGPVLVLGQAASQYGYGFAAWSAGMYALAWPRLPRSARLVIGAFALAVVLHGMVVARAVRHVGRIQAVYSPALAAAASRAQPGRPITLSPDPAADAWIFQRLSHAIPTYRGTPIEGRIRLLPAGAPADHRILPDGQLTPAPR